MSYKVQKTLRSFKQINPWGVLSGIFFLVVLIIIGFYIYTKLQIGRMEAELKVQQDIHLAKKQELSKIVADPWYLKYQASKLIEKNDIVSWEETIEYLVEIYDEIEGLDDNTAGLALEGFNVTFNHEVNLRGSIDNIRSIYLPDGLIDRFENLDAIETVHIPFYRRGDAAFEFVLDAKIKTNEPT